MANSSPLVANPDNFGRQPTHPIFPRPVLKRAVLIPIAHIEDGREMLTYLATRAGEVQAMQGDFYGLVTEQGTVRRGSARIQWEAMHERVEIPEIPGLPLLGDCWVKVTIPVAFQATETWLVPTFIPSPDGSSLMEQPPVEVHPGDWIVRQPGGEIQYVRGNRYAEAYFTEAEARRLDLYGLTAEQFAAWAKSEAIHILMDGLRTFAH